jgi:hypothetical protein
MPITMSDCRLVELLTVRVPNADLVRAEGRASGGLGDYRTSRYARSPDCTCNRGRRGTVLLPGCLRYLRPGGRPLSRFPGARVVAGDGCAAGGQMMPRSGIPRIGPVLVTRIPLRRLAVTSRSTGTATHARYGYLERASAHGLGCTG